MRTRLQHAVVLLLVTIIAGTAAPAWAGTPTAQTYASPSAQSPRVPSIRVPQNRTFAQQMLMRVEPGAATAALASRALARSAGGRLRRLESRANRRLPADHGGLAGYHAAIQRVHLEAASHHDTATALHASLLRTSTTPESIAAHGGSIGAHATAAEAHRTAAGQHGTASRGRGHDLPQFGASARRANSATTAAFRASRSASQRTFDSSVADRTLPTSPAQ